MHEPSEFYKKLLPEEIEIIKSIDFENVKVMAVSKIARNNFLSYIQPNCDVEILEYGIPDMGASITSSCDLINIAIIGTVYPTKGQDIFLKAFALLDELEKKRFHVWIIGRVIDDEYGMKIRIESERYNNISITGQINRNEIEELERKMDVIISPSREDCLPIVITEGLMLGKLCAVSNGTGFASIISNYENGIIFEKDNTYDLLECLRWILNNPDKLNIIGNNGRALYENRLSLSVFKHNVIYHISKLSNI